MPYAQLNPDHTEIIAIISHLRGSYRCPNGQTISNIECLSEEELTESHLVPIIDKKPDHDPRYQSLILEKSEISETAVTRTWQAIDKDITSLKSNRLQEANQERDTAINGGVEFEGHVYDTDDRSRNYIFATLASISMGETLPNNFTWRDQDSTHGYSNLQAVCSHRLAAYLHYPPNHL